VLGTSGGTGPQHSADVLHFGVRVGDEYIDPMLLFAPPDLGAIVHLAEPHGGSFRGATEPSVAPSASEVGTIASEIRVDARPPLRPPSWWPTATPPTSNTTRAARSIPRPRSSHRRRDPAPVPVIAAGAVVPAGAFLVRRRRRRAYR
jgi:hypothetical protein